MLTQITEFSGGFGQFKKILQDLWVFISKMVTIVINFVFIE